MREDAGHMAANVGELSTDFLGQSDELIDRLRLRKCVQVKAQIVGVHVFPLWVVSFVTGDSRGLSVS